MATKNEKGKAAAKPTKSTNEDFKYGVADLADVMDIKPESARVQLRKYDIPKRNGNQYGWKTKDDMNKDIEKMRSAESKPAPKAKAKVKAAGTEKPAKSSKPATKAVPKKKAA